MTVEADSQTEADIAAYVNGQLDGERRFAVAAYLAGHPDRAAGVMEELRLTEGLRLALGRVEAPPSPGLQLAAARLQRGLAARQQLRRWMPFAAAAATFVLGWSAQALWQQSRAAPMAALIEAALDAQDAVTLRQSLVGALGPMTRNAGDISDRLGIELPELPPGWVIRAAQVVATPERPGVALVIDTPDLGEIMLFGVRRSSDGPDTPADTATRDGRTLAFFERDRTAYVLVDRSGPARDLRRGAEDLRLRLN